MGGGTPFRKLASGDMAQMTALLGTSAPEHDYARQAPSAFYPRAVPRPQPAGAGGRPFQDAKECGERSRTIPPQGGTSWKTIGLSENSEGYAGLNIEGGGGTPEAAPARAPTSGACHALPLFEHAQSGDRLGSPSRRCFARHPFEGGREVSLAGKSNSQRDTREIYRAIRQQVLRPGYAALENIRVRWTPHGRPKLCGEMDAAQPCDLAQIHEINGLGEMSLDVVERSPQAPSRQGGTRISDKRGMTRSRVKPDQPRCQRQPGAVDERRPERATLIIKVQQRSREIADCLITIELSAEQYDFGPRRFTQVRLDTFSQKLLREIDSKKIKLGTVYRFPPLPRGPLQQDLVRWHGAVGHDIPANGEIHIGLTDRIGDEVRIVYMVRAHLQWLVGDDTRPTGERDPGHRAILSRQQRRGFLPIVFGLKDRDTAITPLQR
jgi:hypothetical protein